jgi:DNA-binding beta-propeller fold protein YncE
VDNTESDNVSAFAVGSNGTLTAVPGSPFASGDFTGGLAIDSSGSFVYVAQGFEVLGYSIGMGGVLTPLAGSPFAAPGFLESLTLDQTGRFVYGAATSVGVAGFAIDAATGNLTAVTGSPFAPGGNTFSVTTTMGH